MSLGEGRVPRLHIVTDDELLAREGWIGTAVTVLEAGGASIALHVRGPRTSGSVIYGLVCALLPEARRTGGMLVVNDRVDVAMATSAHAVHLGRRSLPAAVARGLVDPTVRVGVSCRAVDEVAVAHSGGADYAFVGTIFSTPTHPGEQGVGVSGIRDAVSGSEGLPVIGIGGVDPERAGALIAAGAHGIAVVRGVWGAPDLGVSVGAYLEAIEGAVEY